MTGDTDFDGIVRAYIADDMPKAAESHTATPRHGAAIAAGSTAASASRKSSGPASFSFAASDRICRKRRPPERPW